MNTVNQTSIPEIYYLTSRAQMKLTRESVRPDLKLRHLVCHANLVDNLLGELSVRRRNQTMVKIADDGYDSVAISSESSSDEDDLSDSSSDEDDVEYMKQPNYTYNSHPYQQEMGVGFQEMTPPVYSVQA